MNLVKDCKHKLIFKEFNQLEWYCRYCFVEMDLETCKPKEDNQK